MPKSKTVEVLISLDHIRALDARIAELVGEVQRLEDLLDKRMEDSQAVVAHLRKENEGLKVERDGFMEEIIRQAEIIEKGRAMQAELLKEREEFLNTMGASDKREEETEEAPVFPEIRMESAEDAETRRMNDDLKEAEGRDCPRGYDQGPDEILDN